MLRIRCKSTSLRYLLFYVLVVELLYDIVSDGPDSGLGKLPRILVLVKPAPTGIALSIII
jgi:hypothetical protein